MKLVTLHIRTMFATADVHMQLTTTHVIGYANSHAHTKAKNHKFKYHTIRTMSSGGRAVMDR